jgi:hypothetical protein
MGLLAVIAGFAICLYLVVRQQCIDDGGSGDRARYSRRSAAAPVARSSNHSSYEQWPLAISKFPKLARLDGEAAAFQPGDAQLSQ